MHQTRVLWLPKGQRKRIVQRVLLRLLAVGGMRTLFNWLLVIACLLPGTLP
jgi:hypothetical protein